MNAKQSLKICSQQLLDTQAVLARAQMDIKFYNQCIDGMIRGESPCPYCEDYQECKLVAKDGKGCSSWWLAFDLGKEDKEAENENASERVLPADSTDREETESFAGKIETF